MAEPKGLRPSLAPRVKRRGKEHSYIRRKTGAGLWSRLQRGKYREKAKERGNFARSDGEFKKIWHREGSLNRLNTSTKGRRKSVIAKL